VALFAAVLAAAVVLLALLAVAPLLRVFDSKRVRGTFLMVVALVAVVGGFGARWYAHREARQRERAASLELLAVLEATPPAALRSLAVEGADAASPSGVTGAQLAADGTVRVFRPVAYAWVRWCVLGEVTAEGVASVRRVHAPCP
jgi:hypothetical protein